MPCTSSWSSSPREFWYGDPGETSLPCSMAEFPSPHPGFIYHIHYEEAQQYQTLRSRTLQSPFSYQHCLPRGRGAFGIYGLNPQPCIATDCSMTDTERLGFFLLEQHQRKKKPNSEIQQHFPSSKQAGNTSVWSCKVNPSHAGCSHPHCCFQARCWLLLVPPGALSHCHARQVARGCASSSEISPSSSPLSCPACNINWLIFV